MQSLINYISSNFGAIASAVGQHILISLIALLLAMLLAIPAAIVVRDRPKIGGTILQFTSALQTLPSLAVLGLLIPLVGIGTLPTIIALVLYALMPIFANTYLGLKNIDPQLQQAAQALGLPTWFNLVKIQLPLALPAILTGVRQALVLIIGTATLAALIGAGGLGTYIILGIQTNNNNALIVGAGLAAALALLTSALLKYMAQISWRKLLLGLTAAVMLVGGSSGWWWATHRQPNIVIAGKMGSEPEILINMYKQLIEHDNRNIKVTLKPNFGGTSFLFNGLRSGKIDIYPEFTGTALQSLVKTSVKTPRSPAKATQLAQRLLAQQYHLTLLAPMKYQNGYALVVTRATARKYHLKTLSDLAHHPTLTAAFDPDFYQQSDGYPGLKKTYGISFKSVRTMEPTLRYLALASKKVQVSDGYTTDPQIKQYQLVALQDNKHFFPPYQGAPLMTTKFAHKYPQVVASLNKLAGKISDRDMQTMNYLVTVKHEKPAVVAHNYLVKHGLLK